MKLVDLPTPHLEKAREAAAYLRELADRMEAGGITDIVVVFNDAREPAYASWGKFKDRWRLYGALEYAKACVDKH